MSWQNKPETIFFDQIKKGLVQKSGNPLKMALTDLGFRLAAKLADERETAAVIHNSQTGADISSQKSFSATTNSSKNSCTVANVGTNSAVFSEASWMKDVSLGSQRQESPSTADDDAADRPFAYCYVTDSGKESSDQNHAVIGFNENITYLIKCRKKGNLKKSKCMEEHLKILFPCILLLTR